MTSVEALADSSIVSTPAQAGRVGRARRAWRWLGWVGAAVLVMALLQAGLSLREWCWTVPTGLRFQADIQNAMGWGGEIVRTAQYQAGKPGQPINWRQFLSSYYRAYDRAVTSSRQSGRFGLDYPPLRLLVMSAWMKTVSDTEPNLPGYRDELVRPLLRVNTSIELFGAVGVFLLVRHWRKRTDEADRLAYSGAAARPKKFLAGSSLIALLAGTLYWFNPAVLMNAHVWPQWDSWLIPFYIWAIYMALLNRWAVAGALLAVAVLLKGQMLLVMPMLVLWPIFSGKFRAAGWLLAGFGLAIGLIVLPWLIEWNFNWYHVGIAYGASHWPNMNNGETYNVASILGNRYGWRPTDLVDLPRWLVSSGHMDLNSLCRIVYGLVLVICAFGASRQQRQRDRHLFIALLAPWILLYCINLQMHERYLVWIGGLSAILVAVSAGWGLMGLLIAVIATVPMMRIRDGAVQQDWPLWDKFLNGLYPGLGWAVLLLGAIFVYFSLVTFRPGPLSLWRRKSWGKYP